MPARRKTNRLRALSGESERHAANLGGGIGAPEPPKWLDRHGKAEWRRVVKACAAYPTWLQQVDRAALSAYCTAWSTFLAAAKDVAERGPLVPGRSSADEARPALVKNPATQILRDAQEALRKWARELGFTPDARGKVELGDREDDDGDPRSPERLLS